MFEAGVEILFKAFAGKPFSHKGKYYTIPPEVPYRGYTLKEITTAPGAGAVAGQCWQPIQAAPPKAAPSLRLAASTTRHCHNRGVISRASMPVTGCAFAIKGVADA